ncbi:hypothetical protein QWZ08_17750 [Ferruginibacter paludis]|uniref:hypothetical protein n=1 Tax=Ferruginibacter paludis TaxID=1310417 RepID=UPI0025B2F519|nr:hypothetical protein [Ferruginibacter paludis]MDN3657501.1 hypothetical protein [Ferruginibacter paludis]
MKKILGVAALLFLICETGFAQKLNGQWRGFFNSKGDIVLTGGDNTEYVLELEIKGTEVTGFSYTYFQDRKYYVICSLAGNYYKSTKSLRVTETAKVKGSTPLGWSDCLQTHILTYDKQDGEEELKGSWRTAPGQLGECGTGTTTLTRRTLSKNLASFNKPVKPTPFSGPKSTTKVPDLSDKNKKPATPPVAKTKPVQQPAKANRPPLASKDVAIKPAPLVKTTPEKIAPEVKKLTPAIPPIADPNFEKRSADVLKTIEIGSNNFKVDLYDNGSVDGDSVSLFYNGKLILSHKMLSEKAITLTLDATTDYAINELTMYADNLGSIPPNTALMVITDGDKRYEVRISSDLKKSGTIRFVHKTKTDQ